MSGAARRAVVLLSGGLDSTTTLALALERGFEVFALTVRYGQRHAAEIARAQEQARALGAREHRVVDVDLAFAGGSALTDRSIDVPRDRGERLHDVPVTYVPARNTVFLSVALAWAESLGARDLFVGANVLDYSGYPDCRPEFFEAFEELARRATKAGVEGERFRVHAPLLHRTKSEIVHEAVRLGVDLARTLSCYDPGPAGEPCGTCESCALRAKGFREAGLVDPAVGR
jgi:7-cyano-7-deazaguanine synthase